MSDRKVFDPVFDHFVESCPKPDVIVFLDGTLDVVKRNIATRSRPSDKLIADSFLEKCLGVYREFYSTFEQVPLIQKNVEQFDVMKESDLRVLMKNIEETLAAK